MQASNVLKNKIVKFKAFEGKTEKGFLTLSEAGKYAQLEQQENFKKELGERQIFIRVLFAAVEQLDLEIMTIKPIEGVQSLDRSLGAEGSGIIEDVGSKLDQSLKGKKCAFCWGAWSEFLVRDIEQVIVFNNHEVDAKIIAHSFVNPLTALCLMDKIENLSN